MLATRDVPAGGEMFVDYGEPWFDDRLDEVGPVPFLKNYKRADKLLKKLKVRQRYAHIFQWLDHTPG